MINRYIHLLYVPTMSCNMQCSYCYLGDQTHDTIEKGACLSALREGVRKLLDAGIMPFNISLHGGEVTTLPPEEFRDVVRFITEYYAENRSLLREMGFKADKPHIKTNLFGLDRHIDAIREYEVSISGSLDLPLSMHRQYRRDKGGRDTLDRILANVEMLRELPVRKKVSATIFREHYEHLDEIIQDIWYLHRETCLDMNDFNFMIGFASPDAPGSLTPLTQAEQVDFFNRIHQAFDGTELEEGMNRAWFAEFTPDYCTNCTNCGSKFFLLERSGDMYSCVRGQGHPEFYYGNLFRDSVEDILQKAVDQIEKAHGRTGFDAECGRCPYLFLCKTGCPFVKNTYNSAKSYTCLLQQELYRRMDPVEPPENFTFEYLSIMHPDIAEDWFKPSMTTPDGNPSLYAMIQADEKLKMVYDPEAFILNLDGRDYKLISQLLRRHREALTYLPGLSQATLYMRRDVLNALSDYPVNNALYIMLLTGDTVVYGDEQRTKQAHVATHMVHGYALEKMPSDREGFYKIPLEPLLNMVAPYMSHEVPNNLFFTTTALRDYHYTKQKNNAYYHMQAINLPFCNIEMFFADFPALHILRKNQP